MPLFVEGSAPSSAPVVCRRRDAGPMRSNAAREPAAPLVEVPARSITPPPAQSENGPTRHVRPLFGHLGRGPTAGAAGADHAQSRSGGTTCRKTRGTALIQCPGT
jgi:hypothetical protein